LQWVAIQYPFLFAAEYNEKRSEKKGNLRTISQRRERDHPAKKIFQPLALGLNLFSDN
jgi:hypothetical protein